MHFSYVDPSRYQFVLRMTDDRYLIQTQSVLKRKSTEPMPVWDAKKFIQTGLESRAVAPVVTSDFTAYFKQ